MWLLYDDFLLSLREHCARLPWVIDSDHCLRTLALDDGECCPITALCATLCHSWFDPGSYRTAGVLLGLDRKTIDAIAQAADLRESYNAHVRADLIDVLGLDEIWAPEGRWNDPAFHATAWPHQYDPPFRRGYGLPGAAMLARPTAHWKYTAESPIVVSPPRLTVRIETPAARLSISSGSLAIAAASSSAFSVGVSRPGYDFAIELAKAG